MKIEKLLKLLNEKQVKYLIIGAQACAAHGYVRATEDIDILVEFDKNHMPGLLDLAGMEIELQAMLGRKVDLRTPAELSRYFRDDVLEKAKVEYAI